MPPQDAPALDRHRAAAEHEQVEGQHGEHEGEGALQAPAADRGLLAAGPDALAVEDIVTQTCEPNEVARIKAAFLALQLWLTQAALGASIAYETNYGAAVSVYWEHRNLFGGAENTLWLQIAQGSTWLDMGFAGGTQDSNYKRWRIADSLVGGLGNGLYDAAFAMAGEMEAGVSGARLEPSTASPLAVQASGTLIAGWPVRLNTWVFGVRASESGQLVVLRHQESIDFDFIC